jgi:hypothetical protein
MSKGSRILMAAAAATALAACAKKAEQPAAPVEEAAQEVVAEEAVSEPVVEADLAARPPIGAASVTVTMTNGQPAFGTVSEGACTPGGVCVGGINMNAAGDIDFTGFPPGDITINITLDQSVTGAGYSYPSDPYQAVAIAVVPPGVVTSPVPVFGQANWPAEFDAPSVSGATLSFVDKEDDQNAYEYAIQLQRSDGSLKTMDPRIRNDGTTTR